MHGRLPPGFPGGLEDGQEGFDPAGEPVLPEVGQGGGRLDADRAAEAVVADDGDQQRLDHLVVYALADPGADGVFHGREFVPAAQRFLDHLVQEAEQVQPRHDVHLPDGGPHGKQHVDGEERGVGQCLDEGSGVPPLLAEGLAFQQGGIGVHDPGQVAQPGDGLADRLVEVRGVRIPAFLQRIGDVPDQPLFVLRQDGRIEGGRIQVVLFYPCYPARGGRALPVIPGRKPVIPGRKPAPAAPCSRRRACRRGSRNRVP